MTRKFHSKNLLDIFHSFRFTRLSITVFIFAGKVLFLYFYIKNGSILSISFSIGKLIRLGNAINFIIHLNTSR